MKNEKRSLDSNLIQMRKEKRSLGSRLTQMKTEGKLLNSHPAKNKAETPFNQSTLQEKVDQLEKKVKKLEKNKQDRRGVSLEKLRNRSMNL